MMKSAAHLETLLASRHSCRAFRNEPVSRPVVQRILDMAQRTASWSNSQPWSVFIASGEATQRLRDLLLADPQTEARPDLPFPPRYEGICRERRQACGLQLYASVGIDRHDRAGTSRQALENFRFFGAPHIAIVTVAAHLGVYAAVDGGGYVSSFMLAAESLGVATIAQAALAGRSPVLRAALTIPDDQSILCGIAFGYEDDTHPINRYRTPRAATTDVVTWVEQ